MARIRKETGLTIRIPSDDSSVVRIEGAPEHVSRIKNELLEMVKKMVSRPRCNDDGDDDDDDDDDDGGGGGGDDDRQLIFSEQLSSIPIIAPAGE